ncbi:hypothetical protein G7084_01425 [Weissella coleopterorum]|uniref:Uncharacterized protein n=1 Tax=Weissella coleopterorum TaxID=2714949 RepID=A0A6G8AYM2_9LACO|nr:hypothetical protein [Weissella coleopterorum]QIL50097.1 hypothetical protein G7084_01425 [Weissella coleopterorum]
MLFNITGILALTILGLLCLGINMSKIKLFEIIVCISLLAIAVIKGSSEMAAFAAMLVSLFILDSL